MNNYLAHQQAANALAAVGGLQNAQMQNNALYNQAINTHPVKIPQFNENVPKSELVYEGLLPLFPAHRIQFCQRCMFL